MTLIVQPPEIVEAIPETRDLFEEAYRRRRKRRMLAGLAAVVIGLGAIAWWLSTGSAHGQPPTTPKPPADDAPAQLPAVPSNATSMQTRTIRGFTLRVFAWPTGLPSDRVELDYLLTAPRNAATESSQEKLDPSVASQSGIADVGGAYGPGTNGLEDVRDLQVAEPSIATVRVVDGKRVLDSMSPSAFDGVRFAVLAAINVPSPRPLVFQALNASGAVVYSARFQPALQSGSVRTAPNSSGSPAK